MRMVLGSGLLPTGGLGEEASCAINETIEAGAWQGLN